MIVKKTISVFLVIFVALSLLGCSFFENSGVDLNEPVLTPKPSKSPLNSTISPDYIMEQLFPDGIAQVFRDAYTKAESDETYGRIWSIYYSDMTQNQYWSYLSSLIFSASYRFDIINSDAISAEMLLLNQTTAPMGASIKTCVDDPDYAYVTAYFFDAPQINTNGFEYSVRLDITLYDVDEESNEVPDNSAKNGSVMGMDQEKADKAFFPYDSEKYIIVETAGDEYGGYDCIEKYSFDGENGKMISKRLRLTFADDLDMLMWCYDNMAKEGVKSQYLSMHIVQNTVYAIENIELSDYFEKTYSEFASFLKNSGMDYYAS